MPRGRPHCADDHSCRQCQCQAGGALRLAQANLEQQLQRARQQARFLEEVNVGLVRDFDCRVRDRLQAADREHGRALRELRAELEAANAALQKSLDEAQHDFGRRLAEATSELGGQLDRCRQEAAALAAEAALLRADLASARELEGRLRSDLDRALQAQASHAEGLSRLQAELDGSDRERASLQLKVEGYKVSLRDFEARYEAQSGRLLKEEHLRRQSEVARASQESLVRSLEGEIGKHATIRERLLGENKALQNVANSLDSHVFDLRRKEFEMMRQLEGAEELALRKTLALEGVKKEVSQLKYAI